MLALAFSPPGEMAERQIEAVGGKEEPFAPGIHMDGLPR